MHALSGAKTQHMLPHMRCMSRVECFVGGVRVTLTVIFRLWLRACAVAELRSVPKGGVASTVCPLSRASVSTTNLIMTLGSHVHGTIAARQRVLPKHLCQTWTSPYCVHQERKFFF
jgi:hypothetical protein